MTIGHRRRALIVAVAATFAVVVDQASKMMAVSWLGPGRQDVFGSVHLHLIANYGAALGFSAPRVVFVVAVAGLVIATLIWISHGSGSTLATVGAGLVVGGGAGNLVDRFVDRGRFPPRAVVDWIDLGEFPTFNLADIAIVVGLVMWTTQSARRAGSVSNRTDSHRGVSRVEPTNLLG